MLEYRDDPRYPYSPANVCVSLDTFSKRAYTALNQAWRRPVRHNQKLERQVLWAALNITQRLDGVLHSNNPTRYLRSPHVDVDTGYEFESALRIIPELLPLTEDESRSLWINTDFKRNIMSGEYRVGAVGQLALVERWHDSLWDSPPGRNAGPSREGEMLGIACLRLAIANETVLNAELAVSRSGRP